MFINILMLGDKMSKKQKIIIATVSAIIIILSIIGAVLLINHISKLEEEKINEESIVLVDFLETDFLADVKVSDFIKNINGTIEDNYKIDTTEIGEKEIKFSYKDSNNHKRNYSFKIDIVDKEKPLIWVSKTYSVTKGSKDELTKKIMCGDNYDPKPTCEIIGNYDLNKVGSYNLTYKATDNSGNVSEKDFTLKVVEPKTNNGGSGGTGGTVKVTKFEDVVSAYKTEDTKIGIDISKWQGDVDFAKLKDAGVEYVFIRVGTAKGLGKENVIDEKFERNISGANEAGIPVGLYFYSYANTRKRAEEDAKWLLDKIKDYKVDLPIAFDWENWNRFNYYGVSFYGLTDVANGFMDTVKAAGYEGMLYSSKTYLENIWYQVDYPVWLAHYTSNLKKSTYAGSYSYWQVCNNGRVDGIKGDVDIDVYFER